MCLSVHTSDPAHGHNRSDHLANISAAKLLLTGLHTWPGGYQQASWCASGHDMRTHMSDRLGAGRIDGAQPTAGVPALEQAGRQAPEQAPLGGRLQRTRPHVSVPSIDGYGRCPVEGSS